MIRPIIEAAKRYAQQGFAIIPTAGKRPIGDNWQHAPVPTVSEIESWQGDNIGMVCGENSNNTIVIDFDGWSGYYAFEKQFPDLAGQTRTVATGSGKGCHVYIQVDILPLTTKAMNIAAMDNANIELRSTGAQVIVPPSIHPETHKPYTVMIDKPVLKLEHVQAIIDWIESYKPADKRRNNTYQAYDGVEPPTDVTSAIFAALGVTGSRTNASGMTAHAILCPFHDDHEPSAGVKMVTDAKAKAGGLYCQACGWHNWQVVAERLSIPLPELERPNPSAQPTITPETVTPDNGVWFAGTMPDTWRSALLQYFPATVAPFVELIHESARQGYIDPQNFTIQEVLDTRKMLGLNLADGMVRKYFKDMLGGLFSKVNILKEKEYMLKNENKSHRPPTIYELLPLDEVKKNILAWARPRIIERQFPKQDRDQLVTVFEQQMLQDAGLDESESAAITELLNNTTSDYRLDRDDQYKRRMKRAAAIYRSLEAGLRSLHSTDLLPIPMDNAKDYRAVFVRSQVEAGQNNRSGNEIARSLGVRREYVGEVLKHAGITNIDRFETVEVVASNVDKLDTIGYEVKGYPRTVTIDNTRIIPYSDECQTIINEAITNGQQVEIIYQVASEQVIARDAILPEKPVRDAQPEQPEKVEAEPKQKAETPVRDEKPRHYGKTFDPNWVKHHLILALHIARLGYLVRDNALIDTRTGEVLRHEVTIEDLTAVLRGQILEPVTDDTDLLIAECILLGGVMTIGEA